MKVLQNLLSKKIIDLNISEREAARQIDLSPTTIGRILAGESVDVMTLIRVCDWIGVSPSYVLDAQLPGEQSLPEAIAAIIQMEPRLEPILKEAVARMERGEISADIALDVVRYAAFRFGIKE